MPFILTIDNEKFRQTNATWNELMLNDPWSVGYVTNLIEQVHFDKKEEWENFYYASGYQREKFIEKLPKTMQELLTNEALIRTDKSVIKTLAAETKNLNLNFGRTREDLYKKAHLLHDALKTSEISLEECFECVRFRVIGETWNGVVLREKNTVVQLQKQLPEVVFKKVLGEADHMYAVDYELFVNKKLVVGIQIKPASYTRNVSYIQKAKWANQKKNQRYSTAFGVKVFTIISEINGTILNPEEVELMRKEIKQN